MFIQSAPVLYTYLFFAACMIAGEWWARRPNVLPWRQRWLRNLALHATVLGAGVLLAAATVFAFAIEAHAADTGLLPFLNTPHVLAFVITFVAFDLFNFLLHRLLHRVPWFWRFHAIHHSSRRQETDSNFGNLFSCWDRLFGCYMDEPQCG